MARPRGNYAVTAARRASILDAALEIFGRSGYNGSSVKQVALAVGMTEAGVLHHFGTKGNLLIEVLRVRDEVSTEYIPLDGEDSLEFVSGWLKLMTFNVNHPGIIDLYTKLAAEATSIDHPAHNYFNERYKFVSAFSETHFNALRKGGHLRDGADSLTLSIALVALADGLQLQWLINPEVDIVKELSAFFASLLTPKAWQLVQEKLETE
ncbi:MAG: TetR/AcrR family transcriptional regulator [Rhodoluna sp.]